jgi:hypothetical protein
MRSSSQLSFDLVGEENQTDVLRSCGRANLN